jgi:hypothetical protein
MPLLGGGRGDTVSDFGFLGDRINVVSDYQFCFAFTIYLNLSSLTDLSQMTQDEA